MKLISMTDFVLHESFGVGNEIINKEVFYNKCSNYAQFLKQPLKLEMFVPCDDEGNVLKDPGLIPSYELEQYRKAKEKVLFEGFEIIKEGENIIVKHNETNVWLTWTKRCIEDLIKHNLTLTENATKQFL